METGNELMVRHLVEGGILKTPLIIEAFRKVDRADFVLPEYLEMAYDDEPLPIGHGQTISQPLTVAFMLELLAPQPGERVLDIGTGSGWKGALVAYVVSSGGALGTVVSVECIPALKEFSEKNLKKYGFIEKGVMTLSRGDGALPLAGEPLFQKIICGAAAAGTIPEAWKSEVSVGGRIVSPVDHSVWVFDRANATEFRTTEYPGFSFVPLTCNE